MINGKNIKLKFKLFSEGHSNSIVQNIDTLWVIASVRRRNISIDSQEPFSIFDVFEISSVWNFEDKIYYDFASLVINELKFLTDQGKGHLIFLKDDLPYSTEIIYRCIQFIKDYKIILHYDLEDRYEIMEDDEFRKILEIESFFNENLYSLNNDISTRISNETDMKNNLFYMINTDMSNIYLPEWMTRKIAAWAIDFFGYLEDFERSCEYAFFLREYGFFKNLNTYDTEDMDILVASGAAFYHNGYYSAAFSILSGLDIRHDYDYYQWRKIAGISAYNENFFEEAVRLLRFSIIFEWTDDDANVLKTLSASYSELGKINLSNKYRV